MHWAVYHDDADLVARLITAGADVNTVNDYGSTPLTEAATAGDTAVIKRLLEAGADAKAPGKDGATALMLAGAAGAASISAVAPSLPGAFASAPASSRRLTTAGLPTVAASPNGVDP